MKEKKISKTLEYHFKVKWKIKEKFQKVQRGLKLKKKKKITELWNRTNLNRLNFNFKYLNKDIKVISKINK